MFLKHLIAATAAGLAVAGAAAAQDEGGEYLVDLSDATCSLESREMIAGSVREKIEIAVRRAESAIQPPAPIGELSCLEDFMAVDISGFSNIGGIMGTLTGDFDVDVAGLICSFAEEKFSELTTPVSLDFADLTGNMPDYSEEFGMFNLGGNITYTNGDDTEVPDEETASVNTTTAFDTPVTADDDMSDETFYGNMNE